MSGCVSIDGGAIEARWDLRDPDGVRLNCEQAGINQVRFAAVNQATKAGDTCTNVGSCYFSCEAGKGVTAFIIPEGKYAISLVAIDPAGKELGVSEGVTVPAPIVRDVRDGEVTGMNVNLLIIAK